MIRLSFHRIAPVLFGSLALALTGLAPASSQAQPRRDTLLVDRAAASKNLPGIPRRGTSMAQVEASLGQPEQKLEPRGGQKRQWPVIHRWVYPEFIVYFERSSVIDVVARHGSPGEIGPMPVEQTP